MATYTVHEKTGIRPMTESEKAQKIADDKEWHDGSADRKLEEIKQIRLKKLKETDYLGSSDQIMTQAMSDYRQGMRDIPQNNATEEQYDLILARDGDGNLTNEIWSKP